MKEPTYLCAGRTFRRLDEAKAYADFICRISGYIVAIEELP